MVFYYLQEDFFSNCLKTCPLISFPDAHTDNCLQQGHKESICCGQDDILNPDLNSHSTWPMEDYLILLVMGPSIWKSMISEEKKLTSTNVPGHPEN